MRKKKLNNKDIDLLKVYSVKKKNSASPMVKMIVLPCTMIIIIATSFGYFTIKNRSLSNDIENMNNEILELQNTLANDPNLEKINNVNIMKSQVSQYQKFYEDIQSYPVLTQKSFDQILLAAGLNVDVTSFSYMRESQVITLQIETISATATEQFVRRLKNTDEFSDVTYSGYTRSEFVEESSPTDQNSTTPDNTTSNSKQETAVTKIVYTSTVLCTLK